MQFALAKTPQDYAQCQRLMKDQGLKRSRLGAPTIMAHRDGQLVGFLGTNHRKDALIAGPLVLQKQSPSLVVRLINAYEQLLLQVGAQAYYFTVNGANARWKTLVDKFADRYGHLQQLRTDEDGTVWYYRTL